MDRRSFLSSLPFAAAAAPMAHSLMAEPFSLDAPATEAAIEPRTINFTANLPAAGTFPERWISGSISAKHNQDPPVQVHWYNEHTAFLRQNKAYSYEAPFMLLYFGNEKILMVDQGYTQLRSHWPLRDVVDGCIREWCKRNGRREEAMELLLVFSHLHDDHYSGILQFADRPNTRLMGQSHEEMIGFWGMTNYPEERVALDLGGRTILVWGSPGHVMSEFAYYDSYTQLLYTGDMFYRGRCYISFWEPWFASMKRLMAFLDTHPVTHVMGCHVEMSKAGEDYPYGVTWQPDEAPWQLSVEELRKTYEFARTITKPGIYYTGSVYLCNQTRHLTTIDKNPYAYG